VGYQFELTLFFSFTGGEAFAMPEMLQIEQSAMSLNQNDVTLRMSWSV
jgi:hypothetical protein